MRSRTLVILAVSALGLMVGTGFAAKGPKAKDKQDSQISLVRPDPAPDEDAQGTLRIRTHKGKDRFDIHVQKVDASQAHDVFIEDPAESAAFVHVTTLSGDGDDLKLALDTKKGDALPLGVPQVADLIGRRVEIRAGDGQVLLFGDVPPFGLSKKPGKAKADIGAPDGAPAPEMHAKLSLRSKADKGQERIELKAKKVPWNDGPFDVFVEDGVGSGVFVNAGDVQKESDSEGSYRRDTKKGQSLPAGVSFVSELAGRTIEVRNELDVVYLRGTIPAVE
jgi:hypothetical protein